MLGFTDRRSRCLAVASCLVLGACGSDQGDDEGMAPSSSGQGGSLAAGGSNAGGSSGAARAPARNLPGVVVVDNGAGTTVCAPLCVVNTDPAKDPEGDDWSWENNASCVIPGTFTSHNQACTTGEPIPPPEPRPGVLIARQAEAECVPICRFATMPSGGSGDWAYEDNASCVLPGSGTATGKRDCTYGEEPDHSPPALGGNKVSDGFYTMGGRLYDAYGNDFVMRGVNNAHIWFDGYAEFKAWHALDEIQSLGTNLVRVVWATNGSPGLLADILHRVVELEMVPMVELHDATGVRAAQKLLDTARYYTRPEVVSVLRQFREYLLVNIANEWSGDADYSVTYRTVIQELRAAGLEHTLVIDASGYGQNAQSIFDSAAELRASDPKQNLLFSIHMYDLFSDPMRVDSVLNQAVTAEVPLIVGEFGHQLSGTDVAWQRILETATALKLGYVAWSWTGNDAETAHLDLAEDWEGPLTQWGHDVFDGPNGITATSQPASIFR